MGTRTNPTRPRARPVHCALLVRSGSSADCAMKVPVVGAHQVTSRQAASIARCALRARTRMSEHLVKHVAQGVSQVKPLLHARAVRLASSRRMRGMGIA